MDTTTPTKPATGRITAAQVASVGRTAGPCRVRGTNYTLTIDDLMKLAVCGDWESGYYQLTTKGANRVANVINQQLGATGKVTA